MRPFLCRLIPAVVFLGGCLVTSSEDDTASGAGGAATTASSTGVTSGSGGGGGSSTCEPPAGVGVFAMGTGERCFEPLTDGQEVPLMQGPQGGYHVWLAIGCADCGDAPALTWGALDPMTGMTLEGTYESQSVLDLSDQAWPQMAGLFVGMPGLSWDPMSYPPPAKGTHVILYAKVSAPGITHEEQVEVVIGDVTIWDPCANDPNNCPDGAGGGFVGG